MARTPSTMLPLGTEAPDFSATDPAGTVVSLCDFDESECLVVMFICNHCPFVIHLREGLSIFATDYSNDENRVAIVAVNSNDIEKYPDDRPEKMAELAAGAGWTFPYLYDETQEIAKAYQAACTPDFYVFDDMRQLVYRGQFDDSRPDSGDSVTGADLRRAVDGVLNGDPPIEHQKPSIGCNIKWKPQNEPAYFSA